MDTNKDIEEAFCAAFSHIIVDGDELLEKAQWVARGFCHLSNHAPDGNVTWDALILQRYDCKIGHGKTTPNWTCNCLNVFSRQPAKATPSTFCAG